MDKNCLLVILLFTVFLCSCCKQEPPSPSYEFTPPANEVSYTHDVKPILEKRCVVCHSCYNSPCQLKFSSWEGIDRGASKERIYNADRLSTMEPSRLFVDAQTTAEWREKGFYGVKPDEGSREYDESIMFLLLDHKRRNPALLETCTSEEHFLPEEPDLTCPESTAEVNNFLKTHPNRGMPFGFPPLSQHDFNLVVGWLTQGAPGPSEEEQKVLVEIPQSDRKAIDKWEQFLNTKDPKYRLTSRYLFEHLFLAHINFQPNANTFYELVRSKTPPGKKIDIIATRRPYDDPGTTLFYYRFRKIHSTIVHKTHMVFTMDERQYKLVEQLFIEPDWDAGTYRMTFDTDISANPFVSFKRIPARSRYKWLLDNAHYTIMTFIRGPVCKGQVALNVVNDHFWLLFLDPEYDLSIQDENFLNDYADKLKMPAEEGSAIRLLKAIFLFRGKYQPWVDEYYRARQNLYEKKYLKGLGADAIWIDSRGRDSAPGRLDEWEQSQSILTVFRHFDSASVHRGPIGKLPKTVWVVDYPVLERIYYSLVAGFDVYGTKGHQGMTRKYMDSLRIEAETAFLEFMPQDVRNEIMRSWYLNLREDKDFKYIPTTNPTKFKFSQDSSRPEMEPPRRHELLKREFLEHVINKMGLQFDHNYIVEKENGLHSPLPRTYNGFTDWVRGFQAVSGKENSFIKRVADHNANVAWIKVVSESGDTFLSVLVDRWHDNINYTDYEDQRLVPAKDKVDIIPGLVASYPNYFFVVKEEEMGQFIKILYEYDGSNKDICLLETYGINRSEPDFWDVYDDFQTAFDEQHKERKGFIDLNRYYSLAMQDMLYRGGDELECKGIDKYIEDTKPWWKRIIH